MTEFVNMPIPVEKFSDVCAVLSGIASAIVPEIKGNGVNLTDVVRIPAVESSARSADAEAFQPAIQNGVTVDSDEIDAHGWPWSADLHASTKGKTKDGLWRMKVGVTRPEPKPGFPLPTTETPSETSTLSPEPQVAAGATEPAGSSQIAEPASAAASPEVDEDDEFAAFRAATAKVDAAEAEAAASVPARVWTDADLAVLCNQAAVKLNDPAPVKALIAEYVPAGEVAHSRNVPADKRAAFVAAVEAKAGIEFAG